MRAEDAEELLRDCMIHDPYPCTHKDPEEIAGNATSLSECT